MSGARVVLPCAELGPSLAFFVDRGFRVDAIAPADAPARATLDGHGLCIELRPGEDAPGLLRIPADAPRPAEVAPNGTRVEWVQAEPALVLPPFAPSLELTRERGGWGAGRAGMLYRDLLPGRQGGRFIASAIRIPEGGPVPDQVHYHQIRFQLIYCVRGRVRVVYEDQGPPFELAPGDCVLQPPQIRHRVLESTPGLEVVELGCPADHETRFDHALELPTERVAPDRDFGGQRFVRHVAADAAWTPTAGGFERRDLGLGPATDGLADGAVLRGAGTRAVVHQGELLFRYVLEGAATLGIDGREEALEAGDSVAVPPGVPHTITAAGDVAWLEVAVGGSS